MARDVNLDLHFLVCCNLGLRGRGLPSVSIQVSDWVKVTQSCPTVCDSMDCTVHGNSPGQNTGVSSLSILQGIFPTQGSNPDFSALQADSLPAKPPGKPKNARVDSLSLLQGIFPTQESNRVLLHCRWIFYQLSYQRSPIQKSMSFNSYL